QMSNLSQGLGFALAVPESAAGLQRFREADCGLLSHTSLAVKRAKVAQGRYHEPAVFKRAQDRQGLAVIVASFVSITKLCVGVPNVVQREGLPFTVADSTPKRKGLLVKIEGLVIVAKSSMGIADVA